MTAAPAPPFEARYSILKMLGWALLALPMVAGGVWMLWRAIELGDPLGIGFGSLGTLFFGGALLAFLRCAADRRVQLRIDGAGMYLRPHSDQTIPLRSIRYVTVATGQVRLRLYKPSKFPIQIRLRRFIYRINGSAAREYFSDAWVWTAHYDCTWPQIMEAIDAHNVPTEF
ncbi:MAG: hypothetical protein ACK4YM_08250 [Novosphingobium sp.]